MNGLINHFLMKIIHLYVLTFMLYIIYSYNGNDQLEETTVCDGLNES